MESSQQVWYNTTHPLPGGIATPIQQILQQPIGSHYDPHNSL